MCLYKHLRSLYRILFADDTPDLDSCNSYCTVALEGRSELCPVMFQLLFWGRRQWLSNASDRFPVYNRPRNNRCRRQDRVHSDRSGLQHCTYIIWRSCSRNGQSTTWKWPRSVTESGKLKNVSTDLLSRAKLCILNSAKSCMYNDWTQGTTIFLRLSSLLY